MDISGTKVDVEFYNTIFKQDLELCSFQEIYAQKLIEMNKLVFPETRHKTTDASASGKEYSNQIIIQ